ncbi:MAG: MMPL family transporter [Pirellulales bacterium]|nr:MMPL family transporter [Pirellulales bacterium]
MSHIGNARFVKRTKITLTLMLLTAPLVIWGTSQGLHRLNDDAISWTASDLESRRDLDWFTDIFGSQNAVLVSWPGATLDDPRLQRLAQAVQNIINDSEYGNSSKRFFREVVTGPEVYRELTSDPLNFSHRQAIDRLQGMFVGPDGRTSCVVIVLTDEANLEARGVLRTIRQLAQDHCDIVPRQLRMVGYLVETATLDNDALNTLYWLSFPSSLIVILIAWPCLRSFQLALLVWISATYCQCLSLSMVYFYSGEMNGMMTILPILLLVIFVSSAVHMINYYQDALEKVGEVAAPTRAFAVGWFPCTLAIATSAIGMASLALGSMAPVRSFGVFASIGTLSTLAILLLVLPGGMHLIETNSSRPRRPMHHDRLHVLLESWSWNSIAELVKRRAATITFNCLGITILSAVGLLWLRGSMQLTDMQHETSRIAQDHIWFQENIGPLLPVEMVLSFDRNSPLSMLDKLELADHIEQAVRSMPGPTSTVSLTAFLPHPDTPGGVRGTVSRTLFNRRLMRRREQIADSNPYLAHTAEKELWRITARIEGFGGQRYEEMLADLKNVVDPIIHDFRQSSDPNVSIVYTGTLPLLAESHPSLIRDLMLSFSVSLLLIAVVLVFGLRSMRLGLMSILPNVFPIMLVFGAFGWMGRTIDVGSMMTASVGLGIAVDGTVHYLTWFARGMKSGLSRQASILNAYQHSAPAMLRTTAICGAGLAVYGLSSFLPAARFGWIICVLLLAALFGDLILLPATLAGRFGRILFPDRKQEK